MPSALSRLADDLIARRAPGGRGGFDAADSRTGRPHRILYPGGLYVQRAQQQAPEGGEMKESVLDILIYLFENYFFDADLESAPEPDRDALKDELQRAGFPEREVGRALEWLEQLSADPERAGAIPASRAIRILIRANRLGLTRIAADTFCIWRTSAFSTPHNANCHRSPARARCEADRHRAGKVGRTDGAVQSTWPGERVSAYGRSGV